LTNNCFILSPLQLQLDASHRSSLFIVGSRNKPSAALSRQTSEIPPPPFPAKTQYLRAKLPPNNPTKLEKGIGNLSRWFSKGERMQFAIPSNNMPKARAVDTNLPLPIN
jgi:hypothetical protein